MTVLDLFGKPCNMFDLLMSKRWLQVVNRLIACSKFATTRTLAVQTQLVDSL